MVFRRDPLAADIGCRRDSTGAEASRASCGRECASARKTAIRILPRSCENFYPESSLVGHSEELCGAHMNIRTISCSAITRTPRSNELDSKSPSNPRPDAA